MDTMFHARALKIEMDENIDSKTWNRIKTRSQILFILTYLSSALIKVGADQTAIISLLYHVIHSVLTKPLRGGLLDLTIFFSKASLKGWIGNIIEYQRVSKENFAILGHFWPFLAIFSPQNG